MFKIPNLLYNSECTRDRPINPWFSHADNSDVSREHSQVRSVTWNVRWINSLHGQTITAREVIPTSRTCEICTGITILGSTRKSRDTSLLHLRLIFGDLQNMGIWPTESTTLKTYFRLPMISSSWQPLRTKLKPVPLKMFAFGFFRLKLGFIVSITTMIFPSKTFNMPSIREGKDGGREPAQCSSYWKMVK